MKKGLWNSKEVLLSFGIYSHESFRADDVLNNKIVFTKNLDHNNFFSFLGLVSLKKYSYHIVTENFEGLPLDEILENDDMKKSLMSNKDKKNKIHQQLCDAMAYVNEKFITDVFIEPRDILVDLKTDKLKIKTFD